MLSIVDNNSRGIKINFSNFCFLPIFYYVIMYFKDGSQLISPATKVETNDEYKLALTGEASAFKIFSNFFLIVLNACSVDYRNCTC